MYPNRKGPLPGILIPWRWRCVVAGLIIVTLLGFGVNSVSATNRYDIYLTRDRVCRRCVGEALNATDVRLTNERGWRTVVSRQEVLGVDAHPRIRRLLFRSLHNIGPAGTALVPYAFENAQDFLCKFCPNSQ